MSRATGSAVNVGEYKEIRGKSKDFLLPETTKISEVAQGLFWIGVAVAGYPDAVVGEAVVHFGDIDFRHMAGRAVFRADWAGSRRVVGDFVFTHR